MHTTALCLRFDSPTLGPHFPISRPIALLLGCIASHWVVSHHVGLHHLVSGCITLHQVASPCVGLCHIVSGRIALCQVMSHCIGSCRIASGWVALHQVRSHQVGSGQLRYYRVVSHYYQPYSVCYPSLLLFPFLHTLFLLFLRRFSLYLHTSLFSFCHCDPGCLPLTLTLPYPCHLSLRYF